MANKRTYQLDEETTITDEMTLLIDDALFAESKRVKVSTLLAAVVASGNYVPYSGATELVDLGAQALKTTGYIYGKKSGVYAYLTAKDDTTITTAATYYPIKGTFNNDVIEDFSMTASPGIQYDGTLDQYFEIDWHATFSIDAIRTATFAIYHNSTLVDGSEMSAYAKVADEKYNVSGTCVVLLSNKDEIQLMVTSDGSGDVVSVHNFTTTIRTFYK